MENIYRGSLDLRKNWELFNCDWTPNECHFG